MPIPGIRLIGDSGLALPRQLTKKRWNGFNSDVAVLLERIPGAWLEIKPASSAIHFRDTNLSGEEMLTLIQPLIEGRPLAADLGRKVIEVHAPKAGKGQRARGAAAGLTIPAASCAAATTRTTARCSSTSARWTFRTCASG